MGFGGRFGLLLVLVGAVACAAEGGHAAEDARREVAGDIAAPEGEVDAADPDGFLAAPDGAPDLRADTGEPPAGGDWEVLSLGAGNRALRGASCNSRGDCLVVGAGGIVLRRSGGHHYPLASGTARDLNAVKLFDDGRAVVVGERGLVLVLEDRFRSVCGDECRALLTAGEAEPADLYAVFGESPEEYFVGGANGTLLRYEDTAFHPEPLGVTGAVLTLWGTDLDNVYVGMERGRAMHLSGQTWRSWQLFEASADVHAIWGSGVQEIWAVGTGGRTVRRRLDGSWEAKATNDGRARTLRAVWGAAEDRVWAVGDDGAVLFWNGIRWGVEDDRVVGPNYRGADLRAIAGGRRVDSQGHETLEVALLGDYGAALRRSPERTWHDMSTSPSGRLRGLWAAPGGDLLVAVGDHGALLVGPEPEGAPLGSAMSDLEVDLYAVAGAPREASGEAPLLWAVGAGGAVVTHQGVDVSAGWTLEVVPAAGGATLRGVFATPSGEVVAVGDNGVALFYDGADWIAEETPVVSRLMAVHGRADDEGFISEAWAVGDDGRILRRAGGEWQVACHPVGSALYSVFAHPDGDVWAAGDNGIILRGRAQESFRLVHESPGSFFYALDGTVNAGGEARLAVAGWAGALLMGDGERFSPEETGSYHELTALAIFESGGVAVGAAGVFVTRVAPWP